MKAADDLWALVSSIYCLRIFFIIIILFSFCIFSEMKMIFCSQPEIVTYKFFIKVASSQTLESVDASSSKRISFLVPRTSFTGIVYQKNFSLNVTVVFNKQRSIFLRVTCEHVQVTSSRHCKSCRNTVYIAEIRFYFLFYFVFHISFEIRTQNGVLPYLSGVCGRFRCFQNIFFFNRDISEQSSKPCSGPFAPAFVTY